MNRNVVIGGVVAVAILLGVAAWFLLSGRGTTTGGPGTMDEASGPIVLNPVSVVTDHSASQSEDGRTLSISFPKFELVAKGGETTSAVFSTTWRLKLTPEERAVVTIATLRGYMKSAGTPPPAPEPVAQPTPATEPATASAPAEGTTPAATPPEGAPPVEQPAATPAPAAPAKPVAGDGIARVIVSIGGEVSVTEWRDWNGEGAEHKLSKAVAFVGAPDLRDGATVPVTVTIEAFGATANETIARLNGIDLRVVPEEAPLPSAAPPAADTTATAPAEVTPPAEDTTPPAEGATPPAEGTTTPPAEGTTEETTPPATPNP